MNISDTAQTICTALIFLSDQNKCRPFRFPFYFNMCFPLEKRLLTYQQVSFFLCCVRCLDDLIQTLRGFTLGFQELCGCRRQRCLNCPFCQQVILLRPAKNIQNQPTTLPYLSHGSCFWIYFGSSQIHRHSHFFPLAGQTQYLKECSLLQDWICWKKHVIITSSTSRLLIHVHLKEFTH